MSAVRTRRGFSGVCATAVAPYVRPKAAEPFKKSLRFTSQSFPRIEAAESRRLYTAAPLRQRKEGRADQQAFCLFASWAIIRNFVAVIYLGHFSCGFIATGGS
jgi:hypothetical protein